MKFDNDLIFFWAEIAPFEVRTEIVYPSKPAAFTAPLQP
jgi:hypothetical protein